MKVSFLSILIISLYILLSMAVFAQDAQHTQHQHGASPTPTPKPADTMQDMPDMPGMQHGSAHDQPVTFIDEILHHDTAGTSAQPKTTKQTTHLRGGGEGVVFFSWR